MHFGASILAQSNGYGGQYDGPVYAQSGSTKIQGHQLMAAHVDEQSAGIVITDFEHNGINDGVWGTDDHNAYFSMVFMRERCTVVVLGWRLDPVPAALEVARADITELADARRAHGLPTVVVDWRPHVEQHPEYIVGGEDRRHLASQEAAVAFADMIRGGLAQCPA